MNITIKGVIASLMLVFVLTGGVFHTSNSQAGWKTKAVAAGCVINKTCRDGAKEIVTTGVEKCTKANCTGKAKDSIKGTFYKSNRTVKDLTDDLVSGKVKPEQVPPVRIFKKSGKWYSLDNRRLKAFKDAGINIRTQKATKAELNKELGRKFNPVDDGWSIKIRGGS